MRRLLLVAAIAAFATAACADGDEVATETETTTVTETETTSEPVRTTRVRVYWLRDGKVWPALREVAGTRAVAGSAVKELIAGPTAQETDDLDLRTAIPGGWQSLQFIVANGVASLELDDVELSKEGLAQLVYTLTQFPDIESVDVDGKRYARADFEDLTPAILVESPLAFEDVESPLRATGTANTFEADFQYEVTDTDGRIVDEGFVRATSGTGTRGTFDFTTDEFTVPFDGIGALIVFESSAKDGSRINLVEIPLRMAR